MDSGSDSDGAPEELTAVQVRLVLSPRGPESRFTITYDLLVYSAQADDGYMHRQSRKRIIQLCAVDLVGRVLFFLLDQGCQLALPAILFVLHTSSSMLIYVENTECCALLLSFRVLRSTKRSVKLRRTVLSGVFLMLTLQLMTGWTFCCPMCYFDLFLFLQTVREQMPLDACYGDQFCLSSWTMLDSLVVLLVSVDASAITNFVLDGNLMKLRCSIIREKYLLVHICQ